MSSVSELPLFICNAGEAGFNKRRSRQITFNTQRPLFTTHPRPLSVIKCLKFVLESIKMLLSISPDGCMFPLSMICVDASTPDINRAAYALTALLQKLKKRRRTSLRASLETPVTVSFLMNLMVFIIDEPFKASYFEELQLDISEKPAALARCPVFAESLVGLKLYNTEWLPPVVTGSKITASYRFPSTRQFSGHLT